MIEVAIVENDETDSDVLCSFIRRYGTERNIVFNISAFSNPLIFIDRYHSQYDIVFLDVEMPQMDGFQVARNIRKTDSETSLVFVTNLAQYAIKGYEVDAIDYIVKPLDYESFALKIAKVTNLSLRRFEGSKLIRFNEGSMKLSYDDISYIEVRGHHITFHTDRGNYQTYGTMKKVEDDLSESRLFFRCNNCYLVNIKRITGIKGLLVELGQVSLQISAPKQRSFLSAVHSFYGSNK
jgi:DNA-binding LytR/AlgR family response regulator